MPVDIDPAAWLPNALQSGDSRPLEDHPRQLDCFACGLSVPLHTRCIARSFCGLDMARLNFLISDQPLDGLGGQFPCRFGANSLACCGKPRHDDGCDLQEGLRSTRDYIFMLLLKFSGFKRGGRSTDGGLFSPFAYWPMNWPISLSWPPSRSQDDLFLL